MEDYTHSNRHRQAESAGKSKPMKERQDPEDFVVAAKHEDLVELLDIGNNIVVAEDDTFGIAGTAAGEDNRGGVIETCFLHRANRFLDKSNGQEPRNHGCCESLYE